MALFEVQDFSYLVEMQGISKEVVQMHLKLYEGYVKQANLLDEELGRSTLSAAEYGALKRRYDWEYDGMRLHELYFGNLGGDGKLSPSSSLAKALAKQWGTLEAWKRDFILTGSIRGIGWAILYADRQTGKLSNVWVDDHHIGHPAGSAPILVMDLFEHAYITQYGLDRGAYINAFFSNLDWDAPLSRYDAVSASINPKKW
jgi:Fe-Mn family superoxide dismutase